MLKNIYIVAIISMSFIACDQSRNSGNIESWKSEIIKTEKAFNDMAQEKGLVEAFHYYAASDGAIRRGKKVITGKAEIKEWYRNDVRPNETLSWTPTFVDVSASGDLAYTYGDYVFTSIDSIGAKKVNKGIFHTVWKRQDDGEWKFVWD